MIQNEDELLQAVDRVSKDIQLIQNYLGQDSHVHAKIKFPYGFIRTAAHFRNRLSFINDDNLVRNISYALILSDVYRWLLNRTNLAGTAKEMVIKEGICLFGALCESITKDMLKGIVGNQRSYKERTKYLAEQSVIDAQLRAELDWMWDIRNNEHLFLVEIREHEHYKLSDYNRAIKALRNLRDKLEIHHKNKKLGCA